MCTADAYRSIGGATVGSEEKKLWRTSFTSPSLFCSSVSRRLTRAPATGCRGSCYDRVSGDRVDCGPAPCLSSVRLAASGAVLGGHDHDRIRSVTNRAVLRSALTDDQTARRVYGARLHGGAHVPFAGLRPGGAFLLSPVRSARGR